MCIILRDFRVNNVSKIIFRCIFIRRFEGMKWEHFKVLMHELPLAPKYIWKEQKEQRETACTAKNTSMMPVVLVVLYI